MKLQGGRGAGRCLGPGKETAAGGRAAAALAAGQRGAGRGRAEEAARGAAPHGSPSSGPGPASGGSVRPPRPSRIQLSVTNGIKLRVLGPFSNGWGPAEPGRKAASGPFGGWSACLREGSPGLILMPFLSVTRSIRSRLVGTQGSNRNILAKSAFGVYTPR